MIGNLIFRSAENPTISLTDPAAMRELFGVQQSDAGVAVTPRSAMSYSPVWQAVSMISGDVAMIPTFVYKRLPSGGKERDKGHPAYPIMRRKANPLYTANVWKQIAVSQALIWGNHYSLINRDRLGNPIELLPLDPDATEPLKPEADGTVIYRTRINHRDERYRSTDIFHIRGTMLSGVAGMSLIHYARNSLGGGLATQKFNGKFFANNAMPGGVIKHPKRLDEVSRNNLRESLRAIHGGVENAHRVAILEEGMEWNAMGIDPQRSQLIDSLKFNVKDVARWFNIPPHRLGDEAQTSFASVEQKNLEYQQSTLGPWFDRIREEAFDKLLTEQQKREDTHTIEEKRIALLSADSKTRHEVYNMGIQNGYYNRDEVRDLEGMNPIPDGDGQTYFIPLNMSETGEDDPQAQRLALVDVLKRCNKRLAQYAMRTKGYPGKLKEFRDTMRERHQDTFYVMIEPVVTSLRSAGVTVNDTTTIQNTILSEWFNRCQALDDPADVETLCDTMVNGWSGRMVINTFMKGSENGKAH